MATQVKPQVTPTEYLEMERRSPVKREYFSGEVYDMGGGNPRHNLIVANLIGELRASLRDRPCCVFPSDMRVKVSATGSYTYPDVVVVCGQALYDDQQRDTLLNPTLLVEVLSESTESHDRGRKAVHYRQLDSLQEYLLVWQEEPHVELYRRQPGGLWLLSEETNLNAAVHLPSLGCDLQLAEVYHKVEWPGS